MFVGVLTLGCGNVYADFVEGMRLGAEMVESGRRERRAEERLKLQRERQAAEIENQRRAREDQAAAHEAQAFKAAGEAFATAWVPLADRPQTLLGKRDLVPGLDPVDVHFVAATTPSAGGAKLVYLITNLPAKAANKARASSIVEDAAVNCAGGTVHFSDTAFFKLPGGSGAVVGGVSEFYVAERPFAQPWIEALYQSQCGRQ